MRRLLFLGLVLCGFAAHAQEYNTRDLFAAQDCEVITPADSDLANGATRLIMVGTSGTLRVTMAGSGRVVNLPAAVVTNGWSAPISVTRIHSTGTTAADIVACR
jgi:hypothetical protein